MHANYVQQVATPFYPLPCFSFIYEGIF
uniref:Uncharacterized protein n=1 Tax=Rhizophora mucronata TaxID=61149 RepID=A0A2P2NLC6_RHIMU